MLLVAILFLICILLIILIYNNTSIVEPFTAYSDSCNELSSKREFLQSYITTLKSKVHTINADLNGTYDAKQENMRFQNTFTQFCLSTRPMSDTCKKLASTDKYPLQELPNVDVYYYGLLKSEVDIDNLLQKLNYYSDLIGCSANTVDTSGNYFSVSESLEDIDTQTAFLELEKLSPYYLSPDVIKYILKFLISKEKLKELNYTSKDYVATYPPLVNTVKAQF